MASETVYRLCQSLETVSSTVAHDPTLSPGEAAQRLFKSTPRTTHHSLDESVVVANEAIGRASECGKWGRKEKPSKLFRQAFADALKCVDNDPLIGVVSPPLMGSHGTMPLTVIAPLADIMRHVSNLIVRAEKEVFFITCSWSPSVAQRLIKNSLIELSRRAGKRNQRVTVKIMYDRAGPMNVIDAHQHVKPSTYSGKAIQLPHPDEVPNLDMEVMSLHKLALGTLHAKFCIVDRKIAAIMSNNVEDNANMEMMTHVEGPIVDSIYDTALITWDRRIQPPLPSVQNPASLGGLPTKENEPLYLDREHGREPSEIAEEPLPQTLQSHTPEDPHYDDTLEEEITRMQYCYSPKENESRLQAANRQLNLAAKHPVQSTGPEILPGYEMTPYIPTETTKPVPMALVNRPPYGWTSTKNVFVPQNEAWLSLIGNAKHNIFIQTPDLNAAPLLPALAAALKRGVEVTYYVCFGYNDVGEMIPGQGGTNDQVSQNLVNSLPKKGRERELLHIYNYVGKDQDHPIHQSFGSRACHIKLLIVDDCVGIQGSGNQDTQSWFHSQEVNVMIDSEEICRKWREGIDRNQNTRIFGRVSDDGIWKDQYGNPGKGYMGNPGKVKGLFKGIHGMIQKMEAT